MISNLLKTIKALLQGPTDVLENVGTLTMMIECCEKMEKQISEGSLIYVVLNIAKDVCFVSKDFVEKVF